MTSEPEQTSRQALAAKDRSLPGRVTGRLRRAIDMMVWEAADRKTAAQAVGMSDHSVREAFRKAHVIQYYREQCEVLRESGRAKRLHRLDALASQDVNRNAAVQAIRVAEQLGDVETARGSYGPSAQPGLVIVIENKAAPPKVIGPVIEHEEGE
jgi:hypothetical protein